MASLYSNSLLSVSNIFLRPVGLELVRRRGLSRHAHLRDIHFLHIGKNAGSTIKFIFDQIPRGPIEFISHPHHVRLCDLPYGAKYFFSIRNPVTRFVSAFYSRKAKGLPRYHYEWSVDEKVAFNRFSEAADLAEALFSHGSEGIAAMAAMKSISHTSQCQIDWFQNRGNFFTTNPPVYIIRQEEFSRDMKVLFRMLDLPTSLSLSINDADSHKRDYRKIPKLSERGVANVQSWYRQDVEFYEACEDFIESHAGL